MVYMHARELEDGTAGSALRSPASSSSKPTWTYFCRTGEEDRPVGQAPEDMFLGRGERRLDCEVDKSCLSRTRACRWGDDKLMGKVWAMGRGKLVGPLCATLRCTCDYSALMIRTGSHQAGSGYAGTIKLDKALLLSTL